jgi:hypothetical protein
LSALFGIAPHLPTHTDRLLVDRHAGTEEAVDLIGALAHAPRLRTTRTSRWRRIGEGPHSDPARPRTGRTITRTIYPEIPPHTEYELTSLGRDLIDRLAALRGWAETHIETIIATRAEADARQG